MSEMINCNLSNQTIFVLNDINKIKDYFNSEIQLRKIMRGKLNKYIAAFHYIDNTLFYLQQVEEYLLFLLKVLLVLL